MPSISPETAEKRPDKSLFTLFNPTPREYLREMEALYESPYTVDAGHVQFEMYVFGYSHNHDTAQRSDTKSDFWTYAPFNLKLGLLNNLDAQVIVSPFSRLRINDRVAGTTTRQSGIGDVIPRLKWNLLGNDGGPVAAAIEPFVKLPTNQDHLGNNSVEGGLIVPLAFELPHEWWLGVSPEFDSFHDLDADGYHFEFASRNYLWHEIARKLSGYVEFDTRVSAERPASWIGTVGFGLTYTWTKYLQLDTGALFGVTRAADDVNIFFGTSFRF
jgi:hypothetical protein